MTHLTWDKDPRDPHGLIGKRGNTPLYFVVPYIGGTFQLHVRTPFYSASVAPFAQGGPLDSNELFDTVELAQAAAEALLGSFMLNIGASFNDAEPPPSGMSALHLIAHTLNERGVPMPPDPTSEEWRQAARAVVDTWLAEEPNERTWSAYDIITKVRRPATGKSGGVVLTGDLVQQLADEAEAGYDDSQLRPRNAAADSMGKMVELTNTHVREELAARRAAMRERSADKDWPPQDLGGIIAYFTPPADTFQTDFDWADAATQAWLDAAQSAEFDVEVHSYEVQHPNTEAAIVSDENDRLWVLTVHDGEGQEKEVRATAAGELEE